MTTLRPTLHPHRSLAGAIAALALLLATPAATTARAIEHAARTAAEPAGTGISLTTIMTGLDQPVFLTNVGDGRLFVVERAGKIKIIKKVNGTWRTKGTFLDIRGKIEDGYDEQGLLGLAFSPSYNSNGKFYVYYTNNSGDEVVAEYRRAKKNKADPDSARKLMTIQDTEVNHNGGWMAFGPDNKLYIATGDGGGGGDTDNHAQNLDTRLGKILRIDPRDPDGSGKRKFTIPDDNPFVGKEGDNTIFAYGLRNPWRDAFDPVTGDLWIADVGQDLYEEVNHVSDASGKNFGWNKLEGFHNYPSGSLCSSNCKTLPVIEYPHSFSGEDNCAVTGGYVSRRNGAAQYGQYFFGDFCSGRIWHVSTSFDNGTLPAAMNTNLNISSFGLDDHGRLYVLDLNGGIYRIEGT